MLYAISPTWLALIITSTVLGLGTQAYINSTFRKWSAVGLVNGMTGAQVAQRVLASNGISTDDAAIAPQIVSGGGPHVRIQAIGGRLSCAAPISALHFLYYLGLVRRR